MGALGAPPGAWAVALHASLCGLVVGAALPPSLARAQAAAAPLTGGEAQAFDVPSGPLDVALDRFARSSGVKLSYDAALVGGLSSKGLSGRFSVPAALRALLEGSGLVAVPLAAEGNEGYAVRRSESLTESTASTAPPAETTLPAVAVQGSKEPIPVSATRPYAGGQLARGGRVGLLGDRDVFETPFNVTHFTAQAIQDKQAASLPELVRGDPAVRVATGRTSFYEDFVIRGFRVTGSATTFDGLSIFPQYGASLLQAIERVEVIKGANTLLGGVTSGLTVGGAINLVPKRATDEAVTDVTLSYASGSRAGAHVDVGRRFGVDNQLGARLNVFGQQGDTAVDNEHEKLSLLALALDFRGEKARAFVDVGRLQQDSRASLGSLSAPAGIPIPAVPSSGSNYVQPFTFSNVTTQYFALRGEYDLRPDVTAYAAFGGNRSKAKQLLPFGLLKNGDGDIDEVFQNGSNKDFNRTWEIGLRAKAVTGPVRHQVVLSVVRSKFGNDGFYVFDEASGSQATVASNIYRPVRGVSQRPELLFASDDSLPPANRNLVPSAAVADTLSMLDDRLLLTLGVRHQRIAYGSGTSYTDGYDKSALTPTVAALFKISPMLSVYGNYIESLQNGPSAPSTAVNRDEVFPPSRNKQYEAGLKTDLGLFGMTASVYTIDQPSGVLDPVSNVFALSGRQKNRGIELSVFGEAAKGIRLNGGVAYTAAKLEKTQDGILDGRRAQAVPRTNLSVSGEYDLPFAPGFTVTGDVVRTGSAFIDQENTRQIAGYTDTALGLRCKTALLGQTMTVRLNVSNVFDKAHWIADVYGSFYQAQPRVFTLSATMNF